VIGEGLEKEKNAKKEKDKSERNREREREGLVANCILVYYSQGYKWIFLKK
jgi:hypothetical protein